VKETKKTILREKLESQNPKKEHASWCKRAKKNQPPQDTTQTGPSHEKPLLQKGKKKQGSSHQKRAERSVNKCRIRKGERPQGGLSHPRCNRQKNTVAVRWRERQKKRRKRNPRQIDKKSNLRRISVRQFCKVTLLHPRGKKKEQSKVIDQRERKKRRLIHFGNQRKSTKYRLVPQNWGGGSKHFGGGGTGSSVRKSLSLGVIDSGQYLPGEKKTCATDSKNTTGSGRPCRGKEKGTSQKKPERDGAHLDAGKGKNCRKETYRREFWSLQTRGRKNGGKYRQIEHVRFGNAKTRPVQKRERP